ncbi:MAG: hypothetical protein R3250_10405, partial [Melioribacteraceae bacterium]|nr:hypothetical protein [Melioribacteraceae bacterium]
GIPDKFVHLNNDEAKDSLILISHDGDNFISSIRIDDEGNFSIVESIPFVNEFNEYISEPDLSKIAGYSVNRRLIEIVTKNYETDQFDPSKYLYTKFPIERILLDNQQNFGIMESNKDTLLHGIMETQDGEYNAEKPEIIDSAVFASLKTSYGNIYYWKSDTSNYYLKEYAGDIPKVLYTVAREDTTIPDVLIIEDQSPESRKIFTTLKFDDNKSHYIVEYNNIHKLDSDNDLFLFSENVQTKYYSNFLGKSNLLIYNASLRNMEFYTIDEKSQKITPYNTIDGIELDDYFLRKYLSNNYLIFTNMENNCISFRIINQ